MIDLEENHDIEFLEGSSKGGVRDPSPRPQQIDQQNSAGYRQFAAYGQIGFPECVILLLKLSTLHQ